MQPAQLLRTSKEGLRSETASTIVLARVTHMEPPYEQTG